MADASGDAVEVIRALWAVEGANSADLDDDCGPTKSCKNMKDITFDGFAEPGVDLGEAWRSKLQREGKINTTGHTIRDLVLGTHQPHAEDQTARGLAWNVPRMWAPCPTYFVVAAISLTGAWPPHCSWRSPSTARYCSKERWASARPRSPR